MLKLVLNSINLVAGKIMKIVKTVVAGALTLVCAASIYEASYIGVRALDSDIQCLKKPEEPPMKKHWWSRKEK